ncbi:MAG: hypothetical protein JNL32_00210 [Candidatus Kapabacteria bacterium]|nr:hypothetical protein [Candidatus Kapabacteria bacterium]
MPIADIIIQHCNEPDLKKFGYHNLVFSSTTQTGNITNGDVTDDVEGMFTHFEAFTTTKTQAQMNTLVGSGSFGRLRCNRRMRSLAQYREVFITRLRFRVDDAWIGNGSDINVKTAFDTSLSSATDGYVQSRFRHGETGGWNPNFFRPIVQAGADTVIGGNETNNYDTLHKGDLSVGMYLPCELELPLPISIGKVPDNSTDWIKVTAFTAQKVIDSTATIKYVLYPLICEMELIGVK